MKLRLAFSSLLLAASSLSAQTVGAPRSFQVVRVPVPETLRSEATASYAAYAVNGFTILGRGTGSITLAVNSHALITIGIPAQALAGTRTAARVVFRAAGQEVEVPVEITVTRVAALKLNAPAEIAGLHPGERFDISYQINNTGNAPDTVRMRVELPAEWRAGGGDATSLIIPPFAQVERVVRVQLPRNSGTGNFFVRAGASSASGKADALTMLTVGPAFDALQPPGAAIRASVGSVAVEGHAIESVPQLAVTGPLTAGLHVDGRLTIAPEGLNASVVRGLASVGTFVTDPHLVAWTPRWRGTLGSTVLSMSNLTGVNAGGRGLALAHTDTGRAFSLVAARSGSGTPSGNDDGALYGAQYEENFSFARLGASAARVHSGALREQELTAFGVHARLQPYRAFTFGGETAYRQFHNGSGMGWSARVRHDREHNRAELQVTHAPGGTQAFARAENEVLFSFLTALHPRIDLSGALADTRDESRGEYAFHARTASLSPSYLITPRLRLRADVRHSAFDVDAQPIGYGNAETHIFLGAGGTWRRFNYSSDFGLAQLDRTISAQDIDASEGGRRFTWRGHLSRGTQVGSFQLETSYERNSPSTGYLPEQLIVNARADRVQIPGWSTRLEFDGELTLQSWSGISTTTIFSAGARYTLAQTSVALGIERNPLLSGMGGSTPWIMALRLERSLGLPRIAVGRERGLVYRDYNSNGQRDSNEPGVPNVAVRRSGARVITEHDGAYRIDAGIGGNTTIEPATLPFGWIVGSNDDGAIGLVATTRLLVTLDLGAAERLRNLDISDAMVIARDATGREWTARRTSPEQAMFEALPVGTYTITADLSALSEPLRVEQEVTIEVQQGELAQARLMIAGRPLRFRQRQP